MSAYNLPLVGQNLRATYKIDDAGITDVDVGKPVKLTTTSDTVALCDAGDGIYGFIDSVEVHTDGGKVIVGVVIQGRVRVTTAAAVGAIVAAGVKDLAGVAKANNWGTAAAHTISVVGDILPKNWMVIHSDGTDGTVESC